MIGIVSYGTYIPKYRIKLNDIATVWQKNATDVISSLNILEKSVPAVDEDAVTLATEAALDSLAVFQGKLIDIGALLVGSESHPYAVNPTSTIVGELLNIGNFYLAGDLQFACKAGTTAMINILGLIKSQQIKYGVAIGTDVAQSKPHDFLEYTSGAAAVSYILGKEKIIAKLIDFVSFSSDTPDFWRRDGVRYPTHAGRFTGEPGYFAHIYQAATKILQKNSLKPQDFNYCVFHMPNGKFPVAIAKRLGFTSHQLEPSLCVKYIGNPYSASSMLGLAQVLDIAKPRQKIFMVSYGSGAGADAFIWETTDAVVSHQSSVISRKNKVKDQIENKVYIDYVKYLKQTHKI